jgi:hypothetical protein
MITPDNFQLVARGVKLLTFSTKKDFNLFSSMMRNGFGIPTLCHYGKGLNYTFNRDAFFISFRQNAEVVRF